jgi:hypothetical protein
MLLLQLLHARSTPPAGVVMMMPAGERRSDQRRRGDIIVFEAPSTTMVVMMIGGCTTYTNTYLHEILGSFFDHISQNGRTFSQQRMRGKRELHILQ